MNTSLSLIPQVRSFLANNRQSQTPGILLAMHMLEMGKQQFQKDVKINIICETERFFPEAVQLFAKEINCGEIIILPLQRYACVLQDKTSQKSLRVSLNMRSLENYPHILKWLLQPEPLTQPAALELMELIEEAGEKIFRIESVIISKDLSLSGRVWRADICPGCGEIFWGNPGTLCLSCQENGYFTSEESKMRRSANISVVKAEDAIGKRVAHDMTQIIPGENKGPLFSAGQIITAGDICKLQRIGRFEVAVLDSAENDSAEQIHENTAAEIFASKMAGEGVHFNLPPHEGKIDFKADYDGVLCLDKIRLEKFNNVPEVMCASLHDGTIVRKDEKFAGTRAIPLFIGEDTLHKALAVLGNSPLFTVKPMRKARIAILVTGTEVFNGLIEDKFIPIMSRKAREYNCEVVYTGIVPDDKRLIIQAVNEIRKKHVDLIVTTGGMSVDPGDVTRPALIEAGLKNCIYGMPVLPGAMAMVGEMEHEGTQIQVLGVPACALYFKNTIFDLLLPRLLAGRKITRTEIAQLGEGGYCKNCKVCTFPNCSFGC